MKYSFRSWRFHDIKYNHPDIPSGWLEGEEITWIFSVPDFIIRIEINGRWI